MSTSHQAQVPPAARRYFKTISVPTDSYKDHPVITAEFPRRRQDGAVGWARQTYRKRISASWARKLRADGVTHVELAAGGHTADFRIEELVR
jgi:hypothetical protein